MKKSALLMALLLGAIAFSGCSKDGMTRCSVEGTLKIGGQPVQQGSISFVPDGTTTSPSSGATIQGGVFVVPKDKGPAPGTFKLQISASEETGEKVDAGGGIMVDEVKSLLNKKYEWPDGAEIPTVELKAGKNTIDLDLDPI